MENKRGGCNDRPTRTAAEPLYMDDLGDLVTRAQLEARLERLWQIRDDAEREAEQAEIEREELFDPLHLCDGGF